jgi:hypothetical protein
VAGIPTLPKNGTHTADPCLTGPLIVNGPFKTITFNSRTSRMLNRRNIRISLFGVVLSMLGFGSSTDFLARRKLVGNDIDSVRKL